MTNQVRLMSAIGPKRTSLVAPHMSALGGKADMAFCGISLSRSLLGPKRTCRFAPHMSAFDPKRTWVARPHPTLRCASLSQYGFGGGDETARVHQSNCWFSGSGLAARGARAAANQGRTSWIHLDWPKGFRALDA